MVSKTIGALRLGSSNLPLGVSILRDSSFFRLFLLACLFLPRIDIRLVIPCTAMNSSLTRVRSYLLLLIGVLTFGTLAIMLVEGLTPFDAFYFVVVTIATVGYGDITPSGFYGKVVSVILIVAGVGTFIAIFAEILFVWDKIREIPIRFYRDHIIICGVHEATEAFVQKFRSEHTKTVVIGNQESSSTPENIRKHGAVLLSGDPKDTAVLFRAHLKKARALLALTDSDGLNAEIALSAMRILKSRRGKPLPCILQISDPGLWNIVREQALLPAHSEAVRVDFYNGSALGARVLISTYFTPLINTWADRRPALLIVVGAGRLGEHIIIRACREWFANNTSATNLQIALIDFHAIAIKERLIATYPRLRYVADIHPISVDVHSQEFQRAGFLKELEPVSSALVFICLRDDSAGLTAALTLQHHLIGKKADILVRMDHNPGIAQLVQGKQAGGITIHSYNSLSIASQTDLVFGGIIEILARAIHDQYRVTMSTHVHEHPNQTTVPWDSLPERLKESNRRQAEHIMEKIRAIGCDILPMTDWTAYEFSFAQNEIEYLAEMEHDRWMDAMREEGFSFGSIRNEQKKKHPRMVPYRDLPENEKNKDRETVRMIPHYLALIDFQIYRPAQEIPPDPERPGLS